MSTVGGERYTDNDGSLDVGFGNHALMDRLLPVAVRDDGDLYVLQRFRTLYSNMSRLLGTLKVAKTKGNLETELKKIERCQLLILDDAFLVPLDVKERAILLDIIEDRHERKSIILSSQLPVSNWYDAIGDPTVADAVLDRIVHTAHQIELTGESVRKINAAKAGK